MDYKTNNLESAYNFEKNRDIPNVPGLSILRIRQGSRMEEYSMGSYGQNKEPVSVDTVYDLASVSKIYTTALVLRQVQEGTMRLDDKLNAYLDYQSFQSSSVTVRDLLTHRVEFGFGLAQYRQEHPDDFKDALLRVQVPDHASDTVNYHNLGFIYLGFALESVSGNPLANQMRTLFSDLGLDNTYTGDSIKDAGIVCPATELMDDGSIVEDVTHDESARLLGGLAGNAGVFASARDLAKFGQAWLDGKVAGQALLDETLHDYDKDGHNPQGLGWSMRFKNGKKLPDGMYGHAGFTGCYLAIDTVNSEVTAITTNRTLFGRDNHADQDIWESVLQRVA